MWPLERRLAHISQRFTTIQVTAFGASMVATYQPLKDAS